MIGTYRLDYFDNGERKVKRFENVSVRVTDQMVVIERDDHVLMAVREMVTNSVERIAPASGTLSNHE